MHVRSPVLPMMLDGELIVTAARLAKTPLWERRASLTLALPSLPPQHGFAIMAGVDELLNTHREDVLQPPSREELDVAGANAALVEILSEGPLDVDVDAAPDGTPVFSAEPVVRIEGSLVASLWVAERVRKALFVGASVATRAARLTLAAEGDSLIDGASGMELNRDTGLALARAAHVGGMTATTNSLAAKLLAIPFRATPIDAIASVAKGFKTGSSGEWGDLTLVPPMDIPDPADEEGALLEAKRMGEGQRGWIARAFARAIPELLPRLTLGALEDKGRWSSHRADGQRGGRYQAFRYYDDRGMPMADVVQRDRDRAKTPDQLGAATLQPLTRPLLRRGRFVGDVASASETRARCLEALGRLPRSVRRLRAPGSYPVELDSDRS